MRNFYEDIILQEIKLNQVQVKIENITKKFGAVKAVDDLSIDIQPGELFTLLGPSGCGKTTLLRTIAGFNYQNSGQIFFNGKNIDRLPPHKRDTGMVFQTYAIFPFLTVSENVAYGLKARKIRGKELKEKVSRALELVRMTEYKDRRPDQLSGGQQQRIAVARAIVIEPKVLLMDEPLSNLDAKLRVEMRTDIRHLQKKLGITMIYVTHDQEEALDISDRIAVLEKGKIAQVGTPWEIYQRPISSYVADFIGTSNFSLIKQNTISKSGDKFKVIFQNKSIHLHSDLLPYKDDVIFSIRPEALKIMSDDEILPENWFSFTSRISETTYLGSKFVYVLDTPMGDSYQVTVVNPDRDDMEDVGKMIRVGFSLNDLTIFPVGGNS